MLQYVLNGLGSVSVAAYTAAQKIDSIATMPMNSFGATMATYAAQNYGAGKAERIRRGVFQCSLISVSFAFLMALVNIFWGSQLAAVFVGNGETEVLRLAKDYLVINGLFYFVLALLFYLPFYSSGTGKRPCSHHCRDHGADHAGLRRSAPYRNLRFCRGMRLQSAGLDRRLYSAGCRLFPDHP